MLYNISTEKWDDKLLDFFGIPKHVLPQVKSSAEHYGNMVSLYVNRLFRRFDKIKRIDWRSLLILDILKQLYLVYGKWWLT